MANPGSFCLALFFYRFSNIIRYFAMPSGKRKIADIGFIDQIFSHIPAEMLENTPELCDMFKSWEKRKKRASLPSVCKPKPHLIQS
jgi:hypothetical protein